MAIRQLFVEAVGWLVGYFIVHSASWRSSVLCQFAGVLATLSSELSVFMLTAITADRAVTLLSPLQTIFFGFVLRLFYSRLR